MKSKELKQQFEQAREYIKKIGAPEPHLRIGSVGRLYSVKVSTEICHQAHPSAKNYHIDPSFDFALTHVVEERFAELAEEALVYLEDAYKKQRVDEKESLLAQLAEIEALEQESKSQN